MVQLVRLLAWLVRLIARHPVAATVAAVLIFIWVNVGWLGLVLLVAWAVVVLAAWRFFWPSSFTRWIAGPVRGRWRGWWCYRRRWAGVMAISGVAPWHQGRIILPVLGKVASTRYTDRVPFGRIIFERYGAYAADPEAIAVMLEAAVADMQGRAARFAGKRRDHVPTVADPFVVVLVDEVAFLTAYQPDRKLKDRTMAALATLTTQGRAVGYCVVAALQDPRKEVLAIRNLFPDRIAGRLDEPGQTDMLLGDGAHDRGAACELISTDPAIGAGVAFIRLEADPDPVRVRAGWVCDADIWAMAHRCAEDAELRPIGAAA